MDKYSAIILCAGKGSRTKLGYNKIFYVLHNKTIYEHTLSIFLTDYNCRQIIVVSSKEDLDAFKKLSTDPKITFVVGGKERQDSVRQGLTAVTEDLVLIHDGARPFLTKGAINDLITSLREVKASLLMVPCKDTIKEVKDGFVVKTLVRDTLMQAQTPQAFHTKVIKEAHQKAKENNYYGTDDCQLVEEFTNYAVKVILGDYNNKKITTPEDLKL